MQEKEQMELESLKALFDELLLKKYPGTRITRFELDFPTNVVEEEEDRIYFERLEEIIDVFRGTELFDRYDELLDMQMEFDCLEIIFTLAFQAQMEITRMKYLN